MMTATSVRKTHSATFAENALRTMTPRKKRQLLLAGGLGLAAAAILITAPELGAISAVGSIGMGIASAVTTFIAKH